MLAPASVLRGDDPQVEAELFAWAHQHKAEEEAAYAWEDSFEFGPIWKPVADERVEREWTRMEEDPDPNERFHG